LCHQQQGGGMEIKMLNRQEIKNKLYELLDEIGAIETDEEGNRTLLGSMDSIQFISLIVEIEECFNIEIPDEYLVTELFENDEHMIDIIEQLIKK
jgi:acyl carrier protein